MAWRDSHASRWRLAMFSLSIVLGIGALVATGSFCANLRQAIEDQSNGLLGADLVVNTFDEPKPELLAYLDDLHAERVDEQVFGSVVTTPAAKIAARMVQVHTIEGNFPLYGEFVTEPANALQRLRAGGNVAILDVSLATQFGLKPGDTFLLGKDSFTVAGTLVRLSMGTQVEAMFMPRVYTGPQPAPKTADGKPPRRRHMLELKLAPGTDAHALVKEMAAKFKEDRLSFALAEDRRQAMQKALPNVDRFLSLVGFVALLLGAVGVAASLHVYVRQKLATVAILRCLGARVWQGFAVYLWQGIALGFFGSVVGALVGIAAQWFVPYLLRDFIPLRIEFALAWPAIGRGMTAGFVMCLLFTLAPLLEVRRVSPLMAIRSAFGNGGSRAPDPWRIALGVTIVVMVVGFALVVAPVWQVGLAFAIAITVSFSALAGVAKAVAWAAKRWFPRRAPYVARQGIANLYRPQNRTVLLLLSLGLGTFLILTLYLTRTTLLRHIEGPDGANRPNLIVESVRDVQIDGVTKTLTEQGAVVVEKVPVVWLNLASLRGRTKAQLKDGRNQRWLDMVFSGQTRVTYRSELEEGHRLIEGEFVGKVRPGDPVVPIVLDQRLARVWRVKVGDEIGWEAKGVPIRTRVVGIEGWEIPRLAPEFRVTFPMGVLEAAPKAFVVMAHVRDPAAGVAAQREVKAAFPNVGVIDVSFFVQTLDRLFAKIAFVIEFLALSIVATGLIMLVCAVLTGRFQRIRETVLLRTLGASRRQLIQIQFVEYAILGALGAFVGCLLAVGANVLLAVYLFHTKPYAPVSQVVAAFAAVIAVTLVTGWFANRGVTDYPPLEVLRQET